jgi:hypothetical protein
MKIQFVTTLVTNWPNHPKPQLRADKPSNTVSRQGLSESGSVKLRYEKCLEIWGNAS